MFTRIKRTLAEKLGLRRLDSAVNYILIRDLNLQSTVTSSDNGNSSLREAFLSLFHVLRPTVFCDIGANDGSASLAVREVAPKCTIYAFEANPQIYARNQSALKQRRITYLNMAVSDSNGRATVFAPLTLSRRYVDGEIVPATVVEAENTGKTSLLLRNEEATYQQFEVEAQTLDSLLKSKMASGSDATYFLWIDVEGAAEKVLAGADKTLHQTLAIFIETENFDFWKNQKNAGDITGLLISKGFVPVARDREYGDKQFNVLFVNGRAIDKMYQALFDARSNIRACMGRRMEVVSAPDRENERLQSRISATADICSTSGKEGFSSVGACMQTDVPVLIPSFNNPTYLRKMIQQLVGLRFRNITVVDGGSTFPPMQEYLSSLRHEVNVVSLDENRGPRNIFLDEKNYFLLPQYFCVTDPDLEFNDQLPSDFLAELVHLTEKHAIGKAGFSLDISDRSQLLQDNFLISGKEYKIWEWEEQFWQQPVEQLEGGDQVYRTLIDTTFAVYNKKYFTRETHLEALRVAGRYACRHLPWYRGTVLPEAEENFYRHTAQFSHYHKQIAVNIDPALATLLDIYRKRPDLHKAFPEVESGQYSQLIEWAVGVCGRRWEDVAYEALHPYASRYAMHTD